MYVAYEDDHVWSLTRERQTSEEVRCEAQNVSLFTGYYAGKYKSEALVQEWDSYPLHSSNWATESHIINSLFFTV